MARLPEFITTDAYEFGPGVDKKILPSGSFVKPIELCYVPKHCFDSPLNKFFSKERDVYCYCSLGLLPIPRNIIREIKW